LKHFERVHGVTRYQIWEAAKNTQTAIEAAALLGMPYKYFVKIAKEMNVFKEPSVQREITLQEILEGKHPGYSTTRLKERLIEELKWVYECSECGLSEWRGKSLVLQLDHIDGNNSNHRLENLRLLCPNCHSQTETFAGRNNN